MILVAGALATALLPARVVAAASGAAIFLGLGFFAAGLLAAGFFISE